MNSKKSLFSPALYAWFVCSLAALFYCYEFLLRIEPSVMFQQLMGFFNLTAGGLGFLSGLYYYAYAPLQAVAGVFTDYYGPKRILTMAIALCAVGVFLFGLTPNIYVAGLGRFFVGVGSAFAFVGILKLAAIWLPEKHFAFFVGLATALGMLGAMIGDIVMSWTVVHYGWHRVMYISAIVGVALMFLFVFFVHEKKKLPSAHHVRLGMRHTFIALLHILRDRRMIAAGFIGFMLYLSLSAFAEMWGIPFLRVLTHAAKQANADLNSMVFLGWLIGAPLGGWVSDWVRSRRYPIIIGSLLAAGVLLIVLSVPDLSRMTLRCLLFLFGLFSSMEVLCFAIGRDITPLKLAGTSMGVINLFIMLSGTFAQPIIGYLLDLMWRGSMYQGERVYSLGSYRMSLMMIPVGMVLAAVIAFFMKETYPKSAKR